MKDVPVNWICKKLKKVIRVSSDAVCCNEGCFICDCGRFVSHSDNLHKVLEVGDVSSVNELDFLVDKSDSDVFRNTVDKVIKKPMVLFVHGFVCVECGKRFSARRSVSYANGDCLFYRDVDKAKGDAVADLRSIRIVSVVNRYATDDVNSRYVYEVVNFVRGIPVIRSINGVWVCFNCYDYLTYFDANWFVHH